MDRLFGYLPENIYGEEHHVKVLQSALEKQSDCLINSRDDLVKQARPSTATWGMSFYEKELGITPDETKPLEQRLSVIRAKRRGRSTTKIEMLKNMAAGFYNGDIEVVDHIKQFWVEIKFMSDTGMPPNIEDLKSVVAEVIPAHLEVTYVIFYNTHNVLSNFTHNQLALYTHRELRKKKLR